MQSPVTGNQAGHCLAWGYPSGNEEARKRVREVRIGGVSIGGGRPVAIQSMTTTDTRDPSATLEQIHRLEEAGCEIVRVAVPDDEAAAALREIKKGTRIPLVADIHFHYKLALKAIDAGVDKIRINPGNLGGEDRARIVTRAAREAGIAMRVGVNSGSLERELIDKYGGPTPQGMVESALGHLRFLEDEGFANIVVSLKASNVRRMIEAYTLMRAACDYPLHLGVTEAGPPSTGTIKSAMGIGYLLLNGIGETLRVSLTADPVEEVRVGWEILKALGLRARGPMLVSCPSCGRCEVDIIDLATRVEKALAGVKKPLHIAVMGCVVNGPGEAREADLAVVGGKGKGLLMKSGQIIATLPEEQLIPALLEEVERMINRG
ncbi:flavodoxin-dependent (E)-4-hydroxy-3-methylbut-2-enyl-diphosphate synthase [bacterium]|nr:flavodoxin-dependent (E)-4-hydroxy-3-methylbut-2-enyl-diphosphate synthase [bacterium]MBU1983777.1 flavodoxin-dependent (E)-4-hydroxy-3-methylbut-2-enyl-diphosphate synthase [bacterium]